MPSLLLLGSGAAGLLGGVYGPSSALLGAAVPAAPSPVMVMRQGTTVEKRRSRPARMKSLQQQQRKYTRALFWTESYYDTSSSSWIGRVRAAEADKKA